jgi:radical SAM superfamily enzyme YgiQ (UPF0313 family)
MLGWDPTSGWNRRMTSPMVRIHTELSVPASSTGPVSPIPDRSAALLARTELDTPTVAEWWAARSYPVLLALAPVITRPDHELAYPGDPMCLYSAVALTVDTASRARRDGPGQGRAFPDLCPDFGEPMTRADRLAASDDGIRDPAARPCTDTSVFDPRVWDERTRSALVELVRRRRPRVLLLSAVSAAHRYALAMAEIVKAEVPGCLVVLGGRHADETVRYDPDTGTARLADSSTPSVIADERAAPVVDFLVSGDGPYALELLMRAISLAMPLDRSTVDPRETIRCLQRLAAAGERAAGSAMIVGLRASEADVFVCRGPRIHIDNLPSPYRYFGIRSRFPVFSGPDGRPLRTAHMMTATSCPYRCSFCSESVAVTGGMLRLAASSAVAVLERISEYVSYGARACFFDDPVFLAGNIAAMEAFCALLADVRSRGDAALPASCRAWLTEPGDLDRLCTLRWGAQLTVDLLTTVHERSRVQFLLRSARSAGCTYLYLGLESMSDRVMTRVHKNLDRPGTTWATKVRRALQLIQDAGIDAGTSILFGLDGETRATIEETIEGVGELLDDGLLQLASPNVLTYHPGAAITRAHQMTDKLDYHSTEVVNGPPYCFFEEAYPGVTSQLLTEDDIWFIHTRAAQRWGGGRHSVATASRESGDIHAGTAVSFALPMQ